MTGNHQLSDVKTRRVACSNCGVVQEATFSRDEIGGVRSELRTDEHCAVCETPLPSPSFPENL